MAQTTGLELFAISISPIIGILGPTGAGKSELGLVLAEAFGGEIVSCDSVQLYSGLDIGSAKLPVFERRGILHHLLDVIHPGEELTAGAYAKLAQPVISQIQNRGRIPIVVGGTGFYFRVLFDGLSPAPERDPDLRLRLETIRQQRPAILHRFVRRFDPQAARRIHPHDHQKLIRAIELIWLGRQSATQMQSAPRATLEGAHVLKLGLNPPRAELYAKLNRRSAWMFEHGLLQESQALLDSGVPACSKALQTLGYRQAVQVLSGSYSIEQATEECQTKTRQYAKRQMTWFRSEPDLHWLSGFGSEPDIQGEALELCRQFLQIFPI